MTLKAPAFGSCGHTRIIAIHCAAVEFVIPFLTTQGDFFEGEVEIHSCKTNRAGWKIPPNFDGIYQERRWIFMGELVG